jgi:hypothetical protein
MFNAQENKAVVHKSLASRQRMPHHTMQGLISLTLYMVTPTAHVILRFYGNYTKRMLLCMYSRSQICYQYFYHQQHVANGVLCP